MQRDIGNHHLTPFVIKCDPVAVSLFTCVLSSLMFNKVEGKFTDSCGGEHYM